MTLLILYLATAVIFLALDAVMLTLFMKPLFTSHLGDAMLESPRMAAAALFYLAYVAGLIWLISLPALRAGLPIQALIGGAVLGAMAYGTYEFTSYAIMKDWHPTMVAADVTWGAVLTGFSAWAGVMVTRALTT
ncbi:DUF2177 family protein [Paracoccaceae bacterium Fryx2]|nr:DUF2177 family protein [Paracoccaceae bacterium Fryx2]